MKTSRALCAITSTRLVVFVVFTLPPERYSALLVRFQAQKLRYSGTKGPLTCERSHVAQYPHTARVDRLSCDGDECCRQHSWLSKAEVNIQTAMVALVSHGFGAGSAIGDCGDMCTHPEAVVGVVGHPRVKACRRFLADLAHSIVAQERQTGSG